MFNHLFDIKKKIRIQKIEQKSSNQSAYCYDVARFDELHPVVSGNKFFKLHYNVKKAIAASKSGLITMGGAYSNHLVSTAFMCNSLRLKSVGLIRGEIPKFLNHTLDYCIRQNMKIIPVSRNQFHVGSDQIEKIIKEYQNLQFVPMGGANEEGISGASEMTDMIQHFESYDVIVCAMGSGTMFKGLRYKLLPHQKLAGIPVMRIPDGDQKKFLLSYIPDHQIKIYTGFGGKGYGKAEQTIIELMNKMYQEYELPLDFIYTGKLIYAVHTLFQQGEMDKSKRILVIHSGGLQGNLSLPANSLCF